MLARSRHIPIVLLCLLAFLGWGQHATAHRRGGLPLVRPAPSPAAPTPSPPGEQTSSLEADVYWQKLLAQEQAGEFAAAQKTGLALVNLFPQTPWRGAALVKAAELAATQGRSAEALELYRLAVCLVPGTPEAAQAGLQAAVVKLSRDLSRGDSPPAMRRFLEQVTDLPPGYASETLQEALKTGWQAVCQQARAADPPPLTLVEGILALWDLQPPGAGPPEAARLLADLLRECGLFEEAQTLLTQGEITSETDPRLKLEVPGLKMAYLSQSWPGGSGSLNQLPPGKELRNYLLYSWLARWRAGVESAALPFVAPSASLMSLGWEEQLPASPPSLKPAAAAPWANRLQAGLAQTFWAEAQLSPLAQIHQPRPDPSLNEASSPFYQDRLGLKHLKNGKTDAAQQTFRNLAQHDDPFWRRLARVRLTDLELSRLQDEPSP